ncbi:MAG: hypothetical protein A2X12_02045 [Bacteroidetes bacterium GWE2_29_8]|nr:MAG: hypothetical protein A2X12_02045 [Bacteroidetes bacterium GWE2_29_8]OFY24560.1 MAG: hypothetical protein A2X02_09825 [Bacteroidetes bacterium GWF2_29_10]
MKAVFLFSKQIALILLISFLLNSISNAQNIEFDKASFPNKKDELKQALRDIEAGDKFYEIGMHKFRDALPFYLKANNFNPNNAVLNYKIGLCYLTTNTKSMAIKFIEKSLELNKNATLDANYHLGRAYHFNYELDKAINQFEIYKSKLTAKDQVKIDDVNKKIAECKMAKELIKKPARVFIDNIRGPVNTRYPEYAPCISADESMMIFTACKDNTTGGNLDPNDDAFYFEDIYISYKNGNNWSEPINPGKPLNSDNHDAAVTLSPDGQSLLIYKGNINGGDIFECKLKGNTWSKPERLGKTINTDYHESSASYGPDGRTIYFVSDKPGGFGDRDIYFSKLNVKGKWEEPINLGPTINTNQTESAVFMHPDGKTLYFASRGHKTMGGFDIFKSVFENGKWSEPENIGYPINTTDDDRFFSITANGKYAYYSSEKEEGFGYADIYKITFLGAEKPVVMNTEDNLFAGNPKPVSNVVIEKTVEVTTSALTILKGKIIDNKTKQPLSAQIEITDNEKNEVVATFESNSTTGKYLISLPSGINYGIAVKAPDYLFYSENIDIKKSFKYNEVVKDIEMKQIIIGNKIVLNNIFFDFDKATLRPESEAELERLAALLKEMPNLKIELSGHTDNKGSATYNKTLSENRSKAVVDYLINNKSIDKNRLTFKGYGFDQPIATNDTEEGRQLNRRTEFKIISK